MRRALLGLALVLAGAGARAQPAPEGQAAPESQAGAAARPASGPAAPVPSACTDFAWSLMREEAWFAAPGLAQVASGDAVRAEMPGAVLALKPDAEVAFPVSPSKVPPPGSYGGVLRFPAPIQPGIYQVTLSDEAWIDVSQDGQTTRPPMAHTLNPACPTLRKSLRYQFGTAPVIIEISGAKRDTIKIAIAPVE
ncbi:hypothetical protein [Methylobacterium planeticum]|uniref:Homogentisate 1,2-dioxygenase n=1 Tax=Methylobacterium planeticum TaxID=2615211 RepID=A0A6N6MWH5_9HYPH|nr:hypothetical protein [Methylobacterium planeticum]KAB1073379.1 hypothetical protein F6X51_11540 [Methylobacterium planeticum]